MCPFFRLTPGAQRTIYTNVSCYLLRAGGRSDQEPGDRSDQKAGGRSDQEPGDRSDQKAGPVRIRNRGIVRIRKPSPFRSGSGARSDQERRRLRRSGSRPEKGRTQKARRPYMADHPEENTGENAEQGRGPPFGALPQAPRGSLAPATPAPEGPGRANRKRYGLAYGGYTPAG